MQPSLAMTGARPSIYSVFEPVERHLNLVRSSVADDCAPSCVLKALDYYLLHKLLTFHATPIDVIDDAAEASLGATTAFLLADPSVRAVHLPTPGGPSPWRAHLPVGVDGPSLPHKAQLRELSSLAAANAGALHHLHGSAQHVVALLAAQPAATPSDLASFLDQLFQIHPHIIVAVFPIGTTGDCAVLHKIMAYCSPGTARRLTLCREISPFLGKSSVALVHADPHPYAGDLITRLGDWFEGNFQFLSLLTQHHGPYLAGTKDDSHSSKDDPIVSTLYVDTGAGMSEKETLRISFSPDTTRFTAVFSLNPPSYVYHIRWDPLDGRTCKVNVKAACWNSPDGQTFSLPVDKLHCNGTHLGAGVYSFSSDDPMFPIPINAVLASFAVSGEWEVHSSEESVAFLRAMIEQKDKVILAQSATIEHKDKEIQTLHKVFSSRSWQLACKARSIYRRLRGRSAG